jgi:protein TorT
MKTVILQRLGWISWKIAACSLILMPMFSLAMANESSAPADANSSSVVVYSIFPPLKPQGSADDALATGRVEPGYFSLTKPSTKPWRVAYLFPHLKDPYWVGCAYGVMNEAKRLGIATDIFAAKGYDDLDGQLKLMDKAIAAKYDAIIVSPISQTGDNAAITKARSLGIPVFELANDSTSDDLQVKVTTSLKSMGFDATRWVLYDAQRRGLKSVNVALLPGPADAGWVMGEVEGTKDAIRKAWLKINILDIKYGDSDKIGQSKLAADLLAKYGNQLDYIIGCTGCAPPASEQIKAAGLGKQVRVVAYDLTREIAGLIRDGDIAAAADTKGVSQALVVTDTAVNFLEGRDKQQPHTILIKLGMVSQENAASYPYDASIAPDGYKPVLSYSPK